MPGRDEAVERAWQQIQSDAIEVIVCLAEPTEVRTKSPAYATALEARTTPCAVESFPIPDFGVPGDREAFWGLASRLADRLRTGGRVLVHCGAGVGRTGTLATCILLALGESQSRAEQMIASAGSRPETLEQQQLVAWCAQRAHTRCP